MPKTCYHCGAVWEEKHTPGLRETCDCGVLWHCCCNCRFYDAQGNEWCREPAARDRKPKNPECGNDCEWFLLRDSAASNEDTRADDAKKNLAALFGDEANTQETQETPDWMKQDGKNAKRDIFGDE